MNTSRSSKIQLCLVTFGVIIGIVGILHGSAELLRGETLIKTNFTEALPENWPNSEFYTTMNGSPVFSVLTDIPYYVLGLLAIMTSITLIVFSVTRLKSDTKGLVLFALLSLGIFLFGAGRGTPIVLSFPLILWGVISLVIKKKKQRSNTKKRNILFAFNLFYWLQIFSWVLFFPGLFVLSFYQEIPRTLFLFNFMIMPISVLGVLIFGLLYDKTIQNEVAGNS